MTTAKEKYTQRLGGWETPNPRCQGPSDSAMPQDDLGILLKTSYAWAQEPALHTPRSPGVEMQAFLPRCAWLTRVSSVTRPCPPPPPLGRGLLPCFPTSPEGQQ